MAERTLKINADLTDLKVGLKDIATSLDRLNKTLDDMGQRTQQNMAKSTQGAKNYKKSLDELQAELKQLEIAQKKAYDQSGLTPGRRKKLDEYKRQIKDVNTQIDRLKAKTDAAANAQGRLNKQVSLGRQLFLRLKSVMLTVFGAYAIIQGIRNTINTIKDFELAVARLQAITGKTKGEIQELADAALALSGSSIFNATEITEASVQLAKFGFTLSEIQDSIEGIVNLATATGEDLGSATTLVSSSIRALGLEAKETARLVDVLGKAFTSSALDINKFRESAKYVLPLARQMGWSIEQVAATLGKLADSGISGSLAGTGLRQMFIQLWDASSDLSEILGVGIKTFDDFFDALERVKDEGVSFDKILSAIPTRAKTMFTVLWNGAKQIRDFAVEMEDAGGAIEDMANIQLDTFAYQMERFESAWSRFILSWQKDGGKLTKFFRGSAEYLNEWANAIDRVGTASRSARARVDDFLKRARGRDTDDNILSDIRGQIKLVTEDISDLEKEVSNLDKLYEGEEILPPFYLQKKADLEALRKEAKMLNDELYGEQIRVNAKSYIKSLDTMADKIRATGVPALESLDTAYKYSIETLEYLRELNPKVYDDITEAVKKYYEENRALLVEQLAKEQEMISETNAQKLRSAIAYYEMERELRLKQNNNLEQSELNRELNILNINEKYDKLIYEARLKWGELDIKTQKIVNDLIKELGITSQRERLETTEEFNEKYRNLLDKGFDEQLKILKQQYDNEIQEMKNNNATKEEIWRREQEMLIHLKELEIQWNELLGRDTRLLREELEGLRLELEGGFSDKNVEKVEDNTKKIAQAYKRLANEIVDYLSDIADAHVQNTERIVDDLNTRIAETQRALEIETELYAAGYASNVTLKKEELDELQKARTNAIADRERAVKRQQQLESIAQAVDLASAIASLIKLYAPAGPVGLVAAGATIAGFIGLFLSMKAKASSLTQYGEGGEIEGASHSQGGVVIEAEGGEFVMRKSAYAKYPELVRAINEDNLPEFNASVMNNVAGGGDVIVDNKVWHDIKDLLDKNLNKKSIEIHGKKKIVTRGIRKRTINV